MRPTSVGESFAITSLTASPPYSSRKGRTASSAEAGQAIRRGAAADNNVYIWDSSLGPPVNRLIGHTTYVHTVSWSSEVRRIASADESGSIRIWDSRTGHQTLTLSYPGGVPMVCWNPYGKSLACVGFGGPASAKIWDATVHRPEGVFWNKVGVGE